MQPKTLKFDPKKILIILHGSIGDVTRALPLADSLRQGFPRAFLAWSVEPLSLPLLKDNPTIDEIIVFDRSRWWTTFGRFLARIRAEQLISCSICSDILRAVLSVGGPVRVNV